MLGACGQRSGTDVSTRVQVPPSFSAYLPSGAIVPYSQLVAAALRDQNVQATADYPSRRDWVLRLSISQLGGMATPTFVLIDPEGGDRATVRTRPVPIETWKRARPETMRQAATEAAIRIAPTLNKLIAERRQTSEQQAAERQRRERLAAQPISRPTRVVIVNIIGAPTDGNRVLRQQLKDKLTKLGEVMQESETGADFSVRAKVDDIAVDDKTRRIEIFWLLRNAKNQEVGEIVQLNEIPVGSLDRGWGDLAEKVTDEAAGAIHDVIQTQLGRR